MEYSIYKKRRDEHNKIKYIRVVIQEFDRTQGSDVQVSNIQ